MTLIVILIGLGLERFLAVNDVLQRFNWFAAYRDLLNSLLKSEQFTHGWLGLLIAVAPLLIIVSLVNGLLLWLLGSWSSLLIGSVILLYCFGPQSFYHDTTPEAIPTQVEGFLQHIFAVIFWYSLLGVFGAVLYRVVQLCQQQNGDPAAQFVLNLLDWIPARLLVIFMSLVGNFVQGFAVLFRYVLASPSANSALLAESYVATLQDNEVFYDICDRVLVISLVLLAIFTLGAWI